MVESGKHAFPREVQVAPWSVERSTPRIDGSPRLHVLAWPVGGTGWTPVGDAGGGADVVSGTTQPIKDTITSSNPINVRVGFRLFTLCPSRLTKIKTAKRHRTQPLQAVGRPFQKTAALRRLERL
jgi:hypothetical protein